MSARICLVTGGTSGVGKSIAKGLARSGATVILVSRDAARGAAAVGELRAHAGHDRIEAMTADLSSMDSVRAFADSFRRRHGALHVLSNNAALLTMTRRVTADGVEAIFATNYLGHFLLTNLLIDMLKASAPARVLTVSGQPGVIARIRPRFADPAGRAGMDAVQRNGEGGPRQGALQPGAGAPAGRQRGDIEHFSSRTRPLGPRLAPPLVPQDSRIPRSGLFPCGFGNGMLSCVFTGRRRGDGKLLLGQEGRTVPAPVRRP